MAGYQFHPGVERWFHQSFATATLPQERGWPSIQAGKHTLIAAPTGSGKTLAAFLASLDRLFRDALDQNLADETRVLYISPLKALSNDIHRNLSEPLQGIAETLTEMGHESVNVRAAVRTGDTPSSERQALARNPPHILVTTPESLYLLLTSQSGRSMLETVDTLIIDEIHALADNRRGAHLALSVERLEALTPQPLQRIGLSATQRPMELVAHMLVGTGNCLPDGAPDCEIVDEGHLRELDLDLVLPDSPLEAVMSNEVWAEIYRQLTELIESHRTTLIFVNTRRLAERITYHLTEKLGTDHVASHHGSLSLQIRRDAEERLKKGELKALVATASLELGIDIGFVDLVCQIGSPRAISTCLQRIGRSGHYYGGVPKGRIFPLTRDELIECTALLHAVRQGRLDQLVFQEKPLDVLSQQIVAAAASEEWEEEQLLALFRRAWLFRNLSNREFSDVVHMLAEGISTRRGRRAAHIFHDAVNGKIRGRKGARLVALTNGGAIPDNADYRMIEEPRGTFIGNLNEDFAIESLPGDIVQLGNHSWRILKIETGIVRVEDAQGQPPTIPFWFGEAPGRTDELSRAVSELKRDANAFAADPAGMNHFFREIGLPDHAALQLTTYLLAGYKALGVLPSQETLVMERFFDEAGGMQLVIHSLFGSRINRAWGLALRKRFCRSFNFELQAAATDDAIVLSLGPKHSFPLEDVFQFLHVDTVENVLVQALLDAPMFQTRWRWNASRSLALLRQRGGKRVPPAFQRIQAEDLIAVVFPDQLACLENIAGDREVPDHPLVQQTIGDCLHEAMDLDGLRQLLLRIQDGNIQCRSLDLPEPSPLAHEILNSGPYTFLDNAPLEERRTRAVYLRRSLDHDTIREEGLLDQEAITTVRQQAWPQAANADELHEALLLMGGHPTHALTDPTWQGWIPDLIRDGRVAVLRHDTETGIEWYVTAERLREWLVVRPEAVTEPELTIPERYNRQDWTVETATVELIRGYLEICGPVTAEQVARWFGFATGEVDQALLALENEGMIFRGHFDANLEGLQWCNRRLLARIHHLTINRLRSSIKPVTIQDYMRFLFEWQHALPEARVQETGGLEAVITQLEGFEAPAAAWEADLLPLRMKRYSPGWLDQLCLTGKVGWGRKRPPQSEGTFSSGPLKTSPMTLFLLENSAWYACADIDPERLSGYARQVFELLTRRGALFFSRIQDETRMLATQTEMALGELVALGLVSSDSFAGLRALLLPAAKKPPIRGRGTRRQRPGGIEQAGRWSLREQPYEEEGDDVTHHARVLLLRYGVVFRRLLEREPLMPRWRDLLPVLRRLEAIGEIRGGYFIGGVGGEQFSLPEAVGLLRGQKDKPAWPQPIRISARDPLNLTLNLLPGPTITHKPGNCLLFRDGLPIAGWEAGQLITWNGQEIDPLAAQRLLGVLPGGDDAPARRGHRRHSLPAESS